MEPLDDKTKEFMRTRLGYTPEQMEAMDREALEEEQRPPCPVCKCSNRDRVVLKTYNGKYPCENGYHNHAEDGYRVSIPCEKNQVGKAKARAGIKGRLQAMTFVNWVSQNSSQETAKARCEQWAETGEGWLYLYGAVGVGKTHLAVAAIHRVCERFKAARIVNLGELLYQLQPNSGHDAGEVREKMMGIPYLVLDELGAHRSTEFAIEAISTIINARYNNLLPTAITSNLKLSQLAEYGMAWQRIVDRIFGATGKGGIIELSCDSKRLFKVGGEA